MKTTTKRALWIGGAVAAVAAVGGIAYAASAPSATPTPKPAPPTPPAPSTPVGPTTLITDPTLIEVAQQALAKLASKNDYGLLASDYGAADVDGNVQNPKFVSALSSFQTYVDTGGGYTEPSSGAQYVLNQQGVLDYATGSALVLYAAEA